jgi:DNA-binding response OmpR family regulator
MPKNKKILLIEDEGSLVNILRERLSEEGYDISVAVQGEEGLHKMQVENPDLVLLDIILPRLDGFVLLQKIKSDSNLKKIPVIVLSNLGQDEDVSKGKQLGAVEYLVKANHPINSIVNLIRKYI